MWNKISFVRKWNSSNSDSPVKNRPRATRVLEPIKAPTISAQNKTETKVNENTSKNPPTTNPSKEEVEEKEKSSTEETVSKPKKIKRQLFKEDATDLGLISIFFCSQFSKA